MDFKIIIPARSGSKGLPGKNTKILVDKPLIDYSIQTALNLADPESIFVTSDSQEILKRGKYYGVNNFLRPKKLASDESPVLETLFHTVSHYEKESQEKIDQIILLQPTFPIRDLLEIKKAIEIFQEKKLSSLVSVTKMKEHPCECISF